MLLALSLRLLAWHWHEQVPLGGDEQEYFNQALIFLREHRYTELKFMRPPAYTVFLSASMYLFDSLVQRIRLIQAILSAITIIPMYGFARELFGNRRVALLAALLLALNYSLASTATELLTETVFVFGLSMLLWLLSLAKRKSGLFFPTLAGLSLGVLVLTRSVALPLLGIGMLWLMLRTRDTRHETRDIRPEIQAIRHETGLAQNSVQTQHLASPHKMQNSPPHATFNLQPSTFNTQNSVQTQHLASPHKTQSSIHPSSFILHPSALIFLLATLLVILPWTARNYLTYGSFILVDTTGAENLWLDNDPAGREAVKAQLYALGDDRALRQSISSQRGIAAITGEPQRFLAKAWAEAQRFMALEHSDDMLARPAIWLPPAEVWLRLILGDGMWLLMVFAGVAGMWLWPASPQNRAVPVLLGLWCLYIMCTSMLFHVELRYRLPVYPVLMPFAAWILARMGAKHTTAEPRDFPALRRWLAVLTCAGLLGLLLLHRNYPAEAIRLASKHLALAQAEQALKSGDLRQASAAAQRALSFDEESALARVALARAALLNGDTSEAEAQLNRAIEVLPAHPYAHILRGALLRANNQHQAAREDLGYESASREDLQIWAWQNAAPVDTAVSQLELGAGLDLGYIQGFYLPDKDYRWTRGTAYVQLYSPTAIDTLNLELASRRPTNAPAPQLQVFVNTALVTTLTITPEWQQYQVKLPDSVQGPVLIELRSPTFSPRSYDRASGDARELGVMVRQVGIP